MSAFDCWLREATRRLSKDSAATVRSEIRDHYESALEAARTGCRPASEAERVAIAALGDPAAANREYRRVLLTSFEAGALREGNAEARVFCSPYIKWPIRAIPVALVIAAVAIFFNGAWALASDLFAGGIAIGFLFVAPFFPVYTPARGRAFRVLKWIVVLATIALVFRAGDRNWIWLLPSCLWPMIWTEWTRMSIRRKLPVARWPKQLYL